ncbi:MAG: HEAT repeat domain-containing protein [Candidatus Limnocylindria bacterium]
MDRRAPRLTRTAHPSAPVPRPRQGGDDEDWLRELHARDASARAHAAFMPGGTGGSRAKVIAALRECLAHDDEHVAEFAAASLAARRDRESLSTLIKRLRTGRPRDRWDTAWAVMELGVTYDSERQGAVEALLAFRRRARGKTRGHTELLLARLSVRSPER